MKMKKGKFFFFLPLIYARAQNIEHLIRSRRRRKTEKEEDEEILQNEQGEEEEEMTVFTESPACKVYKRKKKTVRNFFFPC